MGKLLEGFKNLLNNANKEHFNKEQFTQDVITILFVILSILLVVFVGRFLWDNVACCVLTICKPMPSYLHMFGLFILVDLLYL